MMLVVPMREDLRETLFPVSWAVSVGTRNCAGAMAKAAYRFNVFALGHFP